MARYKVLRSVAHSLGHSFASLMNYRGNDYVMGHLLSRAREVHEPTLLVNLMTGQAGPVSLCTPDIAASIRDYASWFPKLVQSHQTDMQYVSAASLTVTFDLSREQAIAWNSTLTSSPFRCFVEIVDDRGKSWRAEQLGWWYPEIPTVKLQRKPWWRFW